MEIRKNVSPSSESPKQAIPLPGWAAALIVIVVIAGFLFFPRMEHIDDANGPGDFTLATLTEADMLSDTLNCTGGPNFSNSKVYLPNGWELSDGVELSSKRFSGVADLLWADYILPSDFQLRLQHFSVTEGNFQMVVINNGKILAQVQPGDDIDLLIEDLTGPTYVRIAGESAAFSIIMSEFEYDLFQHN